MKKLILLSTLLILTICTSFVAPEELDYSSERREIQENIDQANKNLDEIVLIINNKNHLKSKKIKR